MDEVPLGVFDAVREIDGAREWILSPLDDCLDVLVDGAAIVLASPRYGLDLRGQITAVMSAEGFAQLAPLERRALELRALVAAAETRSAPALHPQARPVGALARLLWRARRRVIELAKNAGGKRR